MKKKNERPLSQKEIVLNEMKKAGSITSWDAIMKFRITRLSARIAELEADGYQIRHTKEAHKLPSGRTTTITRYSLKRGRKK